jgi:hypothetical protein
MKTQAIILGICMLATIVVIGCNKESDDLMTEAASFSEQTPDETKKLTDNGTCTHIDICRTNGNMITVSINAGYTQLEKGGKLFSCDPSVGISLAQIQTQLNNRVLAAGGSISSKKNQSDAFEKWYYDTYCAPDDESEGGGVFEEEEGTDL